MKADEVKLWRPIFREYPNRTMKKVGMAVAIADSIDHENSHAARKGDKIANVPVTIARRNRLRDSHATVTVNGTMAHASVRAIAAPMPVSGDLPDTKAVRAS